MPSDRSLSAGGYPRLRVVAQPAPGPSASETVPSPRPPTPDPEPWAADRIQALLLRVVRAGDVGLLLSEDVDWIRAQAWAMSRPERTESHVISEVTEQRDD